MKNFRIITRSFLLLSILFLVACAGEFSTIAQPDAASVFTVSKNIEKPKLEQIKSPDIRKILKSANEQIKTTTSYTQKYYAIKYPNGDVPKETGACTDVVIRSYRAADIDLQKEVHEDMKTNFAKYPKKWRLKKPDTNIDHRRVPNLRRYFERTGKSLEVTENGENYQPGDIVSWDLNGKGLTHIGIVSNIWSEEEKRYLIIHNIGSGTQLEDRLFEWKITGHYRYFS